MAHKKGVGSSKNGRESESKQQGFVILTLGRKLKLQIIVISHLIQMYLGLKNH